jgi:hypothetical protein
MAEHHPLGDIEFLSYNLLNSYLPGFPILKELVQNAEDAKASCLDYGWMQGIPNATHPLLKSPALFMLDNGEFTEYNAKAIRYILGGSSKPNEQDSIGKFGLGLKSVFHLCEAFFYIAPDIENSKYRSWDIFNPWAGAQNKDEYHEGWDYFIEKDRDLIKSYLKKILNRKDYQEKWFILWIPLRQRNHNTIQNQEEDVPPFIKKGDNEFFENGIPEFLRSKETRKQLSILMALLGTINNIKYWEKDWSKPLFDIRVDASSQRRCNLSKLTRNQKNIIQGKIDDEANIMNFMGSEIILESAIFNNIANSQVLPEKFRRITPHIAIVFSRLQGNNFDGNASCLNLRTAVFLPIGEDCEISCKSEYSYYLTLHGYFFVDFARTGVLGWDKNNLNIDKNKKAGDDDRISLEKEWNFHLYEAILARILDKLYQFTSEDNLSACEISAICEALLNSPLFKEISNREKICQQKQLIWCVSLENNEWKLLDKNIKVLAIPRVPDWNLFRCFQKIAQSSSHVLTLSKAHNLRYNGTKFDKWTDKEIEDIFSNSSAENIFKSHITINYLVDFLKQCCILKNNKIENDSIQRQLIKFIKTGLSQLQWNQINNDIKTALQKIINLIKDSEVIYINISENYINNILRIESLSVLLLPTKLFTNIANNSFTQLREQDATAIFRWFINEFELETKVNHTTVLESILREFLNLSKNHLIKILSNNPSWRCLIGHNKQKIVEFYSYNDFKQFKQEFRLFINSKENMINCLTQALVNFEPVLVGEEIARLIHSDQNILPVYCNLHSYRAILSKAPKLSIPENRKQLLNELLKEVH